MVGKTQGPGHHCGLSLRFSARSRAFRGLQTVVHQAEAAFWLLTPTQRCPLIRSAYLQLLSLLTSGCSKDFLRQVEATVAQELGPSGPDTQVEAWHVGPDLGLWGGWTGSFCGLWPDLG